MSEEAMETPAEAENAEEALPEQIDVVEEEATTEEVSPEEAPTEASPEEAPAEEASPEEASTEEGAEGIDGEEPSVGGETVAKVDEEVSLFGEVGDDELFGAVDDQISFRTVDVDTETEEGEYEEEGLYGEGEEEEGDEMTTPMDIQVGEKSITFHIKDQMGEEEIEEGEELKAATAIRKYMRRKSTRGSIFYKRKSIAYKAVPRIKKGDGTEERRISGDFKVAEVMESMSKLSIPTYVPSFSFEEIEEEEEPEVVVESIDRDYYYDLHKKLMSEKTVHKIKNNILQRKMAEYYRKRKMEHVLKEADQEIDTIHRYNRRLDILGELIELDRYQRTCINEELREMNELRDDQLSTTETTFNQMQAREKEIGSGLIYTKTGKEIPEKVVTRLLHRQNVQANEVSELRLKYIKIRNRVTEKETELKSLDEIAPGLHLIDYEQLKSENRSHADKIEERDEELTRLRVRCENELQCLAHVREKCAACEIEIQSLIERLQEIEADCLDSRERLNAFKVERDNYRLLTMKLEQDAGLLTKPRLLLDFEDAISETEKTAAELNKMKAEHDLNSKQLKAIRKNIEMAHLKVYSKTKQIETGPTIKLKRRTLQKQRIYRGRPTLLVPILPQSESSDFL